MLCFCFQRKFLAFYQYAKSFNSDDFDYEELKSGDYVFMRWKVRSLRRDSRLQLGEEGAGNRMWGCSIWLACCVHLGAPCLTVWHFLGRNRRARAGEAGLFHPFVDPPPPTPPIPWGACVLVGSLAAKQATGGGPCLGHSRLKSNLRD